MPFFLVQNGAAMPARCGWNLAGGGCWAIPSGIFIGSTVKRVFKFPIVQHAKKMVLIREVSESGQAVDHACNCTYG